MKIEKLFDRKLADVLDKYSDTKESVGTNLLKSIENAKDAEMIMPVLGMQGMGKSTLINGLLEENILPNDADETTCVPVEVKYGEEECARVHFLGNKGQVVVHTRKELNEYVDNNYNPANQKGVARIELFRKKELLRGGLVIVDLPGVGSLTKENENTTKRYVENLCSAIFVIPTVPTIRNKEALFIKSLWSQFSQAIFVQNDWGESKAEMEESIDFNSKVLRRIAEELKNPYDDEIIVVNAYNAVAGALQGDKVLRDSSNIGALRDKVVDIASHWEAGKEEILTSRTKLSLQYAKGVIQKRLADLAKSQEEIERENRKKLAVFQEGTDEMSRKAEALKSYLRNQGDEVYFTARDLARECAGKIRADVYKVIDGGVYDGEHLSQAFSDIQERETKEFQNQIINLLVEIKSNVEDKFKEIQELEIKNDIAIHREEFSSESAWKWEQGLEVIMNLGGAAAGYWGAAPLLAACGVAGPAGWVVAVVGAAIIGLFTLVGKRIKKAKQADRASNAKKEVAPHIDEIYSSLTKVIPEKYDEFATSVNAALDKIMADRRDEEKRYKESLARPVDASEEQTLREDMTYITDTENKLRNV